MHPIENAVRASGPYVPGDPKTRAAILAIKERLGEELLILGHHFQRAEVLKVADRVGDSFELASWAASARARYVVFCGVQFMAQCAAALVRPDQTVFHPNPDAVCPMVEMVTLSDLARAYEVISTIKGDKKVVPMAYMNTLADVQAFIGRHGGAIVTSSNDARALRWAAARGDATLFVPDEFIGRNAARKVGIAPEDIVVYDPRLGALGGLTEDALSRAKLVLWAGYCHVHAAFTAEQVAEARRRYPGAEVHVHPECRAEVVDAADGVGSTSYIVRLAHESRGDHPLVIGTEANVVRRLALEHPDKVIVPLELGEKATCEGMNCLRDTDVLRTLELLPRFGAVRLTDAERAGARLALERMLQI